MSTYPKSPETVLRILNTYQPPPGWNKCRQKAGAASKEGAIFALTGNRGDNSWKLRQKSYKCEEQGHIAHKCPLNEDKVDQMHTTIKEEQVADEEDTDDGENIFVQKKEGGVVDRNWLGASGQPEHHQPSLKSCDAHKHHEGKEPIKDTLQRWIYLQFA